MIRETGSLKGDDGLEGGKQSGEAGIFPLSPNAWSRIMSVQPWTVLKSRYLLKRWWMNLREDHVRLPNGTELPEFHVIEYPDWACVVCFAEDGRLVMVEQYRHAIGRCSLEFPAGAVNADEAPLAGAKRELLEETGYRAEQWVFLGKCAPEPSKHAHYAHLFVAHGAVQVQDPNLDASEDMATRLLTKKAVFDKVSSGDIFHGIQLAALFMANEQGFFAGSEHASPHHPAP